MAIYEKDMTRQDVHDHLQLLGLRQNSGKWADYEVAKSSHWAEWTPEVVRWICDYIGI